MSMEENKQNEFKELEKVCIPVVEYLKKNHNPHCTIVITDTYVKVVSDEIGMPVKSGD